MDDLISRQAAIDAINTIGRTSNWRAAMAVTLAGLPSAQPTQSNTTQCVQSVGSVGNHIDRQDAIDTVVEAMIDGADADMVEGLLYLVPSAQPNVPDTNVGDTISRQAAIDALDGDVTVTGRANADAVLGYANLICDRIKGLPSAQQWIPVSSGELPKENGDYYVTYEKGYAEEYELESVGIAPYDADCEAFGIWQERYDPFTLGYLDSDFVDIKVVAWMPLPEAYKGENDG